MSLDGYIAQDNDEVMRLFAWYFSGDKPYHLDSGLEFHVCEASTAILAELTRNIGAMVSGRRTFDISNGWGGEHPYGVPCFVVTHVAPDAWAGQPGMVTFVTDGIEHAVKLARKAAGDKNIAASGATIVQHCLNAGLLDEIHIHLVPVLLGSGVRLFDRLGTGHVMLEHANSIAASGVTHLLYRVIKDGNEN